MLSNQFYISNLASLVFILTLSPVLLGIPEDAQSAFASDQSSTPGSTIPPELVKVANLPGGDIMDIEFVRSSPNVLYLASEPNAMGIWRSDDAGETWRQVLADYGTGGPAHIHDFAVHPDNPDVVLVSDAHSLIKMVVVEDSVEWTIVYPPTPPELPQPEQPVHVFAVAFSPSIPSVAYAADEHGNILKSMDSGDTWQTVGQLEMQWGMTLAVDPGSPDTLYAATRGEGGGVFKSTDGGQNWQQVFDVQDLFISIAPGASDLVFAVGWGGIFKSTDGGATWSLTLDGGANSVQVAPSDPRIVYAGTPEGVLKSDDGGETWANRSTGIEYPNVGPLAVHPNDPNTVIAGKFIFSQGTSGEGIYKTTDGGLSWVKKGNEFIDVDVRELAVDPSNPNLVYAGTRCSRGVYRTEDGGTSWVLLPSGPRWASHYTMRIAAATGSTVWLTGADGMEGSNDRGQTWNSPLNSPLDEQPRHFHGIAISPHDPTLIFVATVGDDSPGTTFFPGARILRSTDGGETWQEVGTGFPSGAIVAIEDFAFDPFNPEVVYVATSTHHGGFTFSDTLGIYKSTDSGDTWMPANTGLTDMNVHSIVGNPATPGLLYAGTPTGIFRSTDGGDSWAYIGLPDHVHRLFIDPVTHFLYAGTDNGLFWSPDGGDTWNKKI